MTENPHAIPAEEFLSRAQVPLSDQVEVQAEPRHPAPDGTGGAILYGDGMSGDADGD
jgi:hypothetical protein